MKTDLQIRLEQARPLRSILLLLLCVVLLEPMVVQGMPMTRQEFRRFQGLYKVKVSGYVSDMNGVTPIRETVRTRVRFRNNIPDRVIPGGVLVTLPPYTFSVRRRLVRYRGSYDGSVVNPDTNLTESISGRYSVLMRRRGEGRRAKYLIIRSDEIRYGTFSELATRQIGRKK